MKGANTSTTTQTSSQAAPLSVMKCFTEKAMLAKRNDKATGPKAVYLIELPKTGDNYRGIVLTEKSWKELKTQWNLSWKSRQQNSGRTDHVQTRLPLEWNS